MLLLLTARWIAALATTFQRDCRRCSASHFFEELWGVRPLVATLHQLCNELVTKCDIPELSKQLVVLQAIADVFQAYR